MFTEFQGALLRGTQYSRYARYPMLPLRLDYQFFDYGPCTRALGRVLDLVWGISVS